MGYKAAKQQREIQPRTYKQMARQRAAEKLAREATEQAKKKKKNK